MDFDPSSLLGKIFGGSAAPPYQMPQFNADGTQSTMQIGGDQNPIMGFLSNNAGGLAQLGTQFQQMNKPAPVPQLQLNMAQPNHAQVQVPQFTGLLNMPVAPANPRG